MLQCVSCATMVTPTGGPKDVKAPTVLKSVPSNFATGFNASTIALAFSEYIQLKDIENQLIISPPLQKTPEIKVKGKGITITFKETLKENTTYNINFGNAISDITEGNVLENFHYVFSTGSYIDSLSVNGKVINAQSLQPEKDVMVMLYDQFNDSLPFKERPLYFAKSKENGQFQITNLKRGAFKLFALKETNGNYLFDQPSEKIAFMEDKVLSSNKDTLLLSLFEDESKRQRLIKSRAEKFGKIVFAFSKPYQQPFLDLLNPVASKKEWSLTEYSKNSDTLTFWYTDPPADSLHFIFTYPTGKADTAHVALEPREKKSKNFQLAVTSNATNSSFNIKTPVLFETSHPIKNYNASLISLIEDSIGVKNFKLQQTDSLGLRHFLLNYAWKENAKYKILIPKKTFIDIYDLTNDTVLFNFKMKSQEDYGQMALKISFPNSGHYIVQLLDEKEHLLTERKINTQGDENLQLNYLDPNKYIIKVVEDKNANGRWDSGSYLEKRQPEKIWKYHEPISIRSNWDVQVDWKIK
jgi:hypothetical protein